LAETEPYTIKILPAGEKNMLKLLDILKLILSKILVLFSKKDIVQPKQPEQAEKEPKVEPEPEVIIEEKERELLSPILHKRYISLYCIADMVSGSVKLLDKQDNIVALLTSYSKSRLDMEGTGLLPDGRVINVDGMALGEMRYKIMDSTRPYGVGIYGKALEPWVSLAHQLSQLLQYSLFGRTVVIPSMRGYVLPDGKVHTGIFRVDDTGGGLHKCPYSNGLWRTGSSKSEYGQFDVFIGGPESVYKKLLGKWDSYKEVFVMPRDLDSPDGIQESLNLLLDAGLKVDGIIGLASMAAINRIKAILDLPQDGFWSDDVKQYVSDCLNSW